MQNLLKTVFLPRVYAFEVLISKAIQQKAQEIVLGL